MADLAPAATRLRSICAQCGTELAPNALTCPACRALVHADTLKELAASAGALASQGAHNDARAKWQEALELLPYESQQHAIIRARVAELTKKADTTGGTALGTATPEHGPWWKRGWGIAVTIAILLVTKLKCLVLGLTKAKTFFSMFAFFGVYWSVYGWPLALGLVLSIYIHEMGHVAMLKHLGIASGAPLFIPGVGAMVLLKQRIDDPIVDARIGLAGPVWGLGAGLAAYGIYLLTDIPIWAAIAQLTGFINLFNLIPVWQLDGSRGFHALSPAQRWGIVGALAVTFLITEQKLLIIVGAVALWRAFQKQFSPGDRNTFLTFVVLIGALAWLSGVHQIVP